MQGTLNKPMLDQATATFVSRCTALGLSVWACDECGLTRQIPESANPPACQSNSHDDARLCALLTQVLTTLQQNQQAMQVGPDQHAVWLPDPEGQVQGWVLVQSTGDAAKLGDLNSLARSLAWTLVDLRQLDQSQFAVDDLAEQLGQSYENITMLYSIGLSMSSLETPQHLAQGICDQLRMTQGYGWSAARFFKTVEDISALTDACLIAGQLPCPEEIFREMTGRMLAQWNDKNWTRLLQVNEHELATLVGSEVILDPIRHDGKVIGVLMAGGKTGPDPEATSGDTQLLDAIAGFLGAFHENAARFTEQKNMFIGSLEAVSTALDAKDPYTYGHSERVAMLGMRLAEAIGLSADEVERIRISGLVHDVGKIGVPESVLCKTGRLTDEEFEQIKKHPRIGYNILKGIPKMADVLDGVLYHHERWDGRGYPDGLYGEAIPLYGRILGVADTFDAMSSTRSYRAAMMRDKVFAEIARCAGTQFDPALVNPFLAMDFSEYDEMVRRHQGANDSDRSSQAA